MSTPQHPAYTMTRDEALDEATFGATGQLCKRLVAKYGLRPAADLVDSSRAASPAPSLTPLATGNPTRRSA